MAPSASVMESVHDIAFLIFLGLAVYWDLAERRIPNQLVLVAAGVAVVLACAVAGPTGAVRSLAGLLVGLGVLLVPFASGLVGGGDAKFFAAVGAFLGPALALRAFLFGTAFGVPLAMVAMWRAGRPLLPVLSMVAGGTHPGALTGLSAQRSVLVPYAVPLALGALAALALERAGALPF
jgi:prepilin peptidase CpaA